MTGSPENVLITYLKISHTDSLTQTQRLINTEHWTRRLTAVSMWHHWAFKQ